MGRGTGREKSRGQSVVEFALTLPIFMWLVMGMFDVGRGVATNSLLGNAAREGARAGIFPGTDDASIKAAARSQRLFVAISDSDITISPSLPNQRVSGATITVTINHTFTPIMTSMLTSAAGNYSSLTTIHMVATSKMLIE